MYEHALIAAGETPENAAVLAQRNEYLRLSNREHPAYGVQDETIFGGGGVESRRARPAGSLAGGRGQTSQSRSSALPASTLSPAHSLTALPSRLGVGSYDEDFAQRMREGFELKYGS